MIPRIPPEAIQYWEGTKSAAVVVVVVCKEGFFFWQPTYSHNLFVWHPVELQYREHMEKRWEGHKGLL